MSSQGSLSAATEAAVCELVDNRCPIPLSGKAGIVVLAYIAVFVPWGLLALFDFITDRWKTVNTIRWQGYIQFILAPPTIVYTLYYVKVQAAEREYAEMSAAIVATFFSLFHFLRTFWGLMQLHYFTRWVKTALKCMHTQGYPLMSNDFPKKPPEEYRPSILARIWRSIRVVWCQYREKVDAYIEFVESHSLAETNQAIRTGALFEIMESAVTRRDPIDDLIDAYAETMYINNSIIDNEFFDTDIPCYFKPRKFFHPFDTKEPWILPKSIPDCSIRWMVMFLALFGTTWLKDSRRLFDMPNSSRNLKDASTDFGPDLSVQAAMMTTSISAENSDFQTLPPEEKWTKFWSKLLLCRDEAYAASSKIAERLPFGARHKATGYGRYQPRIRRLAENLPPDAYENFSDEQFELAQSISSFDLENFVVFLHTEFLFDVDDSIDSLSQDGSLESSNDFLERVQSRLVNFGNAMSSAVRGLYSFIKGNQVVIVNGSLGMTRRYRFWTRCRAMINRVFCGFCERSPHEGAAEASSIPPREAADDIESSGNDHVPSPPAQTNEEANGHDQPSNNSGEANVVDPSATAVDIMDERMKLTAEGVKVMAYQLGLSSDSVHKIPSFPCFKCPYASSPLWSSSKLMQLNVQLDNRLAILSGFQGNHQRYAIMGDSSRTLVEQFQDGFPRDTYSNRSDMIRIVNKQLEKNTHQLPQAHRSKQWREHVYASGLRFSGSIMETVRQCIATWLDLYESDENTFCWNPIVPDEVIRFEASAELRDAARIRVFKGRKTSRSIDHDFEFGDKWSLEARILWECQARSHFLITHQEPGSIGGPQAAPLMILCLLGFPSLYTRLKLMMVDENLGIFVGPGGYLFGDIDRWVLELRVEPLCWPQLLGVQIRVSKHLKNIEMKVINLSTRTIPELDGDNVDDEIAPQPQRDVTRFPWQDLRDAFEGSMQAIIENESGSEIKTNKDISAGNCVRRCRGDGTQYALEWDGWQSHNPDVSMSNIIMARTETTTDRSGTG